MEQNNLEKEKIKKFEELRKKVDVYPHNTLGKVEKIKKLKETYISIKKEEKPNKMHVVCGRITLFRNMGKVAFITIKDEFEVLQLAVKLNECEEFELLDYLDIGDIICAKGSFFKTKVGELTLLVKNLQVASKSIKPYPDKFHGLKDTEIKYRKRYLDLIMNKESSDVFMKRLLIMKYIREFLDKQGFLEVETPILQNLYGGAAAKPFTTYHNALKKELYLRISPELYLKRLLIGGFNKIYEINKNFRNEDIDTTHNPEFTMMELYQAYADYNDMMKLTENLYEFVALKVNGTTKVNFKGKEVDLKAPWNRISMLDAIKKYAKIDASNMDKDELLEFVQKNNIEFDKEKSWGNLVVAIFEELCEDKFVNPTFVLDHPKESTPLCKVHRKDPRLVERFEPFCMGMELANAYSELNNPFEQRETLLSQAKLLKKGDEEANPLDEDFIEAMEYGMPPAGGLGIGIDRMIMLLCEKESIKDILFFPVMKDKK